MVHKLSAVPACCVQMCCFDVASNFELKVKIICFLFIPGGMSYDKREMNSGRTDC